MIINKSGQIVANIAQPTVIFETAESYNAWVASLPSAELEANFIVIKTYELAPGGVYEVETNAERTALPASQKVNETLYIVKEDNSGWRWDIDETTGDGTWVQLFGEGFDFKYVQAVDTKADLPASGALQAENVVYIVKDENAFYRYDATAGEYVKVTGNAAKSIKKTALADLDADVYGADEMVYVTELDKLVCHDTGDDVFYGYVGNAKVFATKPTASTTPVLAAGQAYFATNSDGDVVVKLVVDPADASKDFEMSLNELESGIFFKDAKAMLTFTGAYEDLVKMVVDPATANMFIPYHFTNEDGACKAFKRVNSHGGDVGFYFNARADFPPVTGLSAAELAATYVDMSNGKGYQIIGNPADYIERGIGEQEQEVITVENISFLPAIPSRGVIYVVEKSQDGTKVAGDVKIANPLADFTQPESETNKYYLSVGTDISALIERIEHLEQVADDVIVKESFAQFPAAGATTVDQLWVDLSTKKCYVTKVNLGGTYEWVAVGGDDLINQMPAMTLTEWQALSEDERPDYANIIPEDGEDRAMFDGFSYQFTD